MIPVSVIKQAADTVGFHACGVSAACRLSQFERELDAWLDRGCQASMDYMAQHHDMRCDPTLLLPGARSVISVLLGYKPSAVMRGSQQIARYAYGPDYHETVKKMLYAMVAEIRKSYPAFEAKACVDTVPIADKHWAQRSGLGWIGKNTLLINKDLGSLCFVGELVTTEEVSPYDQPIASCCADCNRCVEACPNHAIQYLPEVDAYVVNSERCLSYQTIENRAEHLPADLKRNQYVYGCDCCQNVCPYNQDTPSQLYVSDDRLSELENLIHADEAAFKRFVKHSAMNRIKYAQWRRNLRHSDTQ